MRKSTGLWISVGGRSLAKAVAANIENHGQFTFPVAASDVRPRAAELVVVSMEGTRADYVGISQAGRRVATGQTTIVISNLVAVKQLDGDAIRGKLPRRFAGWFAPPEHGVYRPTPRLWEEILNVVAAERPDVGAKIGELKHIISRSRLPRRRIEGGLEVFERDAVASSLQAWGGPSLRKRVLRNAVPSRQTPVASFLSQIKGFSVREDLQIGHDHATFPGMEVARRDIVGSVVLTNGEEYLTILNCNRQPLERTLGVDLIYYNHRFDSFVLVQYKRMTEGKHGWPEYRPDNDQSHAKEIRRMVEADKILRALPNSGNRDTDAFRLSARPFYVKLCEPKAKASLDAGMVSGMYLPLGLWRRLLDSPAVRGRRGGVTITWDNCARRFNNGEFTNLLRHGWIGSAAGQSKEITRIIEDVLGSGHMLVLAATSAGPTSRDLRRDDLGRFAADDDPAGAI